MRVSFVLGCLLLVIGFPASAEEGYGPLIANGLDEELAIGADLFFSETFEGNGRTCATRQMDRKTARRSGRTG